ncbi:hypothetical protein EWM62_04230 [Mucilaginibacter terrigena]|uniref:Outer membrane protein beta-barrel domain-containing protein n=1 Tax=Mucilaginibacter terrigena TaxID=2492395 RepID=A0A4Q5LP42_9SPHI|nr:outer membrane beta-barrel protein [Mucilaginibacter terrigena]RYU91154.1 hypothetical protein EWM62_04230 [Mucilaginibacter terrigena]
MDEQFDNKLTNHISEVFDNYEHPGVEYGWEQLKKKLPAEEKGKKVAWLWWSSAAAVVLVFLSIGLWFNNQGTGANNIAVKPAINKQQPAPVTDSAPANTGSTDTSLTKQAPVMANNAPAPAANNSLVTPRRIIEPGATAPGVYSAGNMPSNTKANTWVGHPQPWQLPSNGIAQTVPATNNSGKPAIDTQKAINSVITDQPQIASNTQPVNNNVAQTPNNIAPADGVKQPQPTKRSIDAMFEADRLQQTARNNKKADKQTDKKVNFSVYAATYFNYAEGSTNQINAGAGFTSDFKLSKNLKLSTGIALAQNSLSYNTTAPQAATNTFAAAAPLKQEALFGSSAALVPVFKNYNANLVGLDIPINIKYEFNPQKSDAYISAGLSSGTFIDENYTYRYTYGNGASAQNSQSEQTAHNSFNSFYFGKTLNLSFGLGYPVGNNRLIVEPFVKYPLGGLGAQDIRFGAGGVNLKFSFKTQKK